jgi:hypothetical protein
MTSKYTFLSLLVVVFACSANAQSIITYAGTGYGAGTGTGSHTGDGGAAATATFYKPTGVASNGYSNLYVADQANHVVRKIGYTGIITTLAGNDTAGNTGDYGPADKARLNNPVGVAVDAFENVYIADYYSNVVRKVSTSGIITTIAGTGVAGYSGDGGPATSAELYYPYGVAVDGSGNVYIADANNNVIRQVNAAGGITTIAGTGFGAGLGLGHGAYSGDGGAATNARLNFPEGVAVDNYGNVFIADANNHVIRKISTSGTISTVAGSGVRGYSGDGGAALAASLDFPSGIAADGLGNFFIADQGNNTVRKVNASGVITSYAGNGASGYGGDNGYATSAQLNAPTSVAVDGNGFVYIADHGNNVIRLVAYPVSINAVPGNNAALNVYPNPSNGEFTLELPKTGNVATVTISDVLGRTVETKSIDNTKQSTVIFSHMPVGSYVVKVISGDKTFREKIVVMQ